MVLEKVIALLAEQLGFDAELINENTDILEDLGADSLDLVELMMSVEEEFSLTVEDEEIKELKTVGDVIRFIEDRI